MPEAGQGRTPTDATKSRMPRRERVRTRDGSAGYARWLVGIGATLGLLGGATHGDLPERDPAGALRFVADHPAYALVHLVSIVGAVLWVVGIRELGRLRAHPAARAAGDVALIGAAVIAVQFSMDGIGLEAMARAWSAPGADRSQYEAVVALAPDLIIGVALTWVLLLYGLSPALYGWSLLARGKRALGGLGIALGTLVSTGAVTLMLAPQLQPMQLPLDALVFGGATIGGSLWLVAVAVLDRGPVN